MKKLISILFVSAILSACNKSSTPSCTDGKQNQNETGVDCGGVCKSCPSCVDGIQNQGETGVDCGGPCPACATCSDGIQNQGEAGIDCGGPCKKCSIIYNKTGVYGDNAFKKDTLIASQGVNYSLQAEIPDGSTLKVIMKNNNSGTSNIWAYSVGTVVGWAVQSYDSNNNQQIFSALNKGNCDLQLVFLGSGIATIEFYENGAQTPTRIKKVVWN